MSLLAPLTAQDNFIASLTHLSLFWHVTLSALEISSTKYHFSL